MRTWILVPEGLPTDQSEVQAPVELEKTEKKIKRFPKDVQKKLQTKIDEIKAKKRRQKIAKLTGSASEQVATITPTAPPEGEKAPPEAEKAPPTVKRAPNVSKAIAEKHALVAVPKISQKHAQDLFAILTGAPGVKVLSTGAIEIGKKILSKAEISELFKTAFNKSASSTAKPAGTKELLKAIAYDRKSAQIIQNKHFKNELIALPQWIRNYEEN
jgi:hypothetical protein